VVEILVESGVALQPDRRPARSPARPNEATFRRRRAVRRAVREDMSRAPSDALIEGSVTGGIKGDNDTFEGPFGDDTAMFWRITCLVYRTVAVGTGGASGVFLRRGWGLL
jgi:hypothetical protein